VSDDLGDDEYAALQHADRRESRSRGRRSGLRWVRRLRWGLSGRDKRGGIRVVYYLRLRRDEIWMLTLYAKTEAENIPGPVLKRIKEALDGQD
jgi:hypothetical protein